MKENKVTDWLINWKEVDPLIKDNSDRELARRFGMHYTSIQKRRYKLKIRKVSEVDQKWKEIDPFLGKDSDNNIAKKFGFNQSNVSHRRRSLGIKKFNYNFKGNK
jgi:hypothetical protein